jgi:hypothetical protein
MGLLALIPPGAAAGAPARTITKSEIRSDPPQVTDRKLRDVFWSMFASQDHRGRKAPTRRLSGMTLRTKAQATRVPGLCRYDNVRIEFEPVKPGDEGPDAPVRPVGLTSTSHFTFLSAPAAEYEEARQDRLGSAEACSGLPEDQAFFTARDEQQATAGYRAWLALRESVRAGRKFPLECSLTRLDTGSCESIIANFKPEQLEAVDACESETDIVCHALYVGDRLIKVRTSGHVYPGPKAGQLVSAKLDTLIVLAHEIID